MGWPHASHNNSSGTSPGRTPCPQHSSGTAPGWGHRALATASGKPLWAVQCRESCHRLGARWRLYTLILSVPEPGCWLSSWFSVPPAAPRPAQPPLVFIQVQRHFIPADSWAPATFCSTCLLLKACALWPETQHQLPMFSHTAVPARLWLMNSAPPHCTAVLQSWYLLAAHPSCDFRPLADVTNAHQLPQLLCITGISSAVGRPPQLCYLYKYFLQDFTFTAYICTASAKPRLQTRPYLQGPLQTPQGCASPETVPADGIGQQQQKKRNRRDKETLR